MKKILFLIDTLGGGGAEKALIDIVNNLPEDKYKVTVSTIFDSGIHRESLSKSIEYKPLLNENKVNRRLFWRILRKAPRNILYKFFIKDKYDVEVAYIEGLSTILLSGSTNKESKKIAWVHTDLYNNYYNEKLFNDIEDNKKVYSKYNNIVCVSSDSKNGFIKRFGDFNNVQVLYNPIDSKKICEIASIEWDSSKDIEEKTKMRFITIGRLINQKGYKRLLEVHKRLINEGLEHEIVILGDGVQKGELEKYIEVNELQNSVKMLGFKSNPYKYLKESDCFVCSSYVEGYPLVVAEALVLGIPVLSTNCTGPIELLGNGEYGLIVDNSESGLYYGMKEVIQDKGVLDILKKKSELGKCSFNLEDIINQIGDVLDA